MYNVSQVVAICGMPGSGKGEFAKIVARHDIPVRSMGDMVRAEVESRGMIGNPAVYGEVAADLRAKYGEDVLAVRLADEVSSLLEEYPIVIIEGMRGTAEHEIFRTRWSPNFSSVAIVADQEIRFTRTQSRGRQEDGDRHHFQIRENREAGWGLLELIEDADYTITNESSLQDLVHSAEMWLSEFRSNRL